MKSRLPVRLCRSFHLTSSALRLRFGQSIDKATLIAEGYQDYIRLTEDAIWSLVSVAADSEAVPVRPPSDGE
jgi:hypothetical protein